MSLADSVDDLLEAPAAPSGSWPAVPNQASKPVGPHGTALLLDPDVMAMQLAMDTLWAAGTDHEELMGAGSADKEASQ